MKTTIIFAVIYSIALFTIGTYGQDFTLTTSAKNIISSRASIGRPGLDGNPHAIIVATPLGDADKYNPHPLGAWYYKDKWNIFNTDHVVMPVNLRYKIEYWPTPDENHFLHILTPGNIGDDGSYLDHPLLNGHPNASFKILQNYTPDDRAGYYLNANEAKAGYNPASRKWYIANVNGKRLYPGTAYSVAIFSDGTESTTPVPAAESPQITKPVPTRTIEPIVQPAASIMPIAKLPSAQASQNGTGPCTKEMAWQTIGKWEPQKKADVAMADRTFPKTQYKAVLAKAQKAIDLSMKANPEFAGIVASAYSGIRGDSIIPNGPLPFRADIWYKSFICVGNDTAIVDKRGKIIVYGNYGFTVIEFNSLRDVLDTVTENGVFSTVDGDAIYEYKKDLGDFKGMTMIEPFKRDGEYHEAVMITTGRRLPYKPVTREQFLRARIKFNQVAGITGDVAGLTSALERMSATERQSPAIVRDFNASPGRVKLFATEAEGGRHLVTLDKSYFNPKLPRDTIQLITVHWHSSPGDRPKVEMIEAFKRNFDFSALSAMIGH